MLVLSSRLGDFGRSGQFAGLIHSPFFVCADPDQLRFRASVYRQRPRRDELIGTARYFLSGFIVDAPRKPGRYYAKVRRDFSDEIGTCMPARSPTITIR
jgi:hypothetical protein